MEMTYQRLGASGLEVPPLCLGTMTFGDTTDAAEAQRIVDAAFDAGVNFIDTADNYTTGASERIVGAAIRANRQRWILATKAGNVMTARPHDGGLSRRWLLRACDDSLARLGTDFIDIYYLHKDDPDTPIVETVGAIATNATQLTPDFELAEYKRQDLVYEKVDLLIKGVRQVPGLQLLSRGRHGDRGQAEGRCRLRGATGRREDAAAMRVAPWN